MKFYEVTKQISLTKHIIDVKLLCVTNKVWNAMTKQQQKWMIEAAQYAGEQGTAETLKWEADNLKFFKDYGLIITEPDIKAFKAYSAQYYKDNGLTKDWDMDLWNRVQALAK
jgi:TRAP-type C4-dicarboxylate transport system substrate-binding protein